MLRRKKCQYLNESLAASKFLMSNESSLKFFKKLIFQLFNFCWKMFWMTLKTDYIAIMYLYKLVIYICSVMNYNLQK